MALYSYSDCISDRLGKSLKINKIPVMSIESLLWSSSSQSDNLVTILLDSGAATVLRKIDKTLPLWFVCSQRCNLPAKSSSLCVVVSATLDANMFVSCNRNQVDLSDKARELANSV